VFLTGQVCLAWKSTLGFLNEFFHGPVPKCATIALGSDELEPIMEQLIASTLSKESDTRDE
jgi:hypothetical protein